MQKLIRGIRQFQGEAFKEKQALFERLGEGQKPDVLFIIRNAGNLIPTYGAQYCGEAGTIEFALAALGIEEIIVCGHSHCGAALC